MPTYHSYVFFSSLFSAYSKFRSTFNIVNVCAFKKEKKLGLCRQVFETSPYKLLVSEPAPDASITCIRREVILAHAFAQSASTKIASFQCDILKTMTTNLFFLGSMYQMPGVIAYMQIPPFLKLFPDAEANGLNSMGLLRKSVFLVSGKGVSMEDKFSIVNDSI